MDEVEWSKAKTRPVGGSDEARRSPTAVLIGLVVGIICTFVAGVYFWFYAPLLPFVVGAVTVLFRRTRAFALGVLAAACGAVVFLVTLLLLFTVF